MTCECCEREVNVNVDYRWSAPNQQGCLSKCGHCGSCASLADEDYWNLRNVDKTNNPLQPWLDKVTELTGLKGEAIDIQWYINGMTPEDVREEQNA